MPLYEIDKSVDCLKREALHNGKCLYKLLMLSMIEQYLRHLNFYNSIFDICKSISIYLKIHGLLDHDGYSKGHEGLCKVNYSFSIRCYGQGGYCNIRFLLG